MSPLIHKDSRLWTAHTTWRSRSSPSRILAASVRSSLRLLRFGVSMTSPALFTPAVSPPRHRRTKMTAAIFCHCIGRSDICLSVVYATCHQQEASYGEAAASWGHKGFTCLPIGRSSLHHVWTPPADLSSVTVMGDVTCRYTWSGWGLHLYPASCTGGGALV